MLYVIRMARFQAASRILKNGENDDPLPVTPYPPCLRITKIASKGLAQPGFAHVSHGGCPGDGLSGWVGNGGNVPTWLIDGTLLPTGVPAAVLSGWPAEERQEHKPPAGHTMAALGGRAGPRVEHPPPDINHLLLHYL